MKKLLLAAAVAAMATVVFAQPASANANYVHSILQEWGSCKTGALTDYSGYVVISGYNRSAWAGIPQSLIDYLRSESTTGRIIDDVCLTERGSWLVVGDRLYSNNAPDTLWNAMSDFVDQGDRILCVTFNDYDDWIIITDKRFSASADIIQQRLNETSDKYGFIHSAAMTNNAMIIIADRGVGSWGNVPASLDDYLTNDQSFDIKYIKFTDNGSWLVTDGNSLCDYFLR